MPRLDSFLIILEDDFHKVVESNAYDRGAKDCRASHRRDVLDCVQVEDSRDVKKVSKLQRGIGISVGDTVNRVAEPAIYLCHRICKHN